MRDCRIDKLLKSTKTYKMTQNVYLNLIDIDMKQEIDMYNQKVCNGQFFKLKNQATHQKFKCYSSKF